MINEVRVRFAPSPTGPLHIGGVRTALFNYFFARKNNGKLILRIEDTDQKRLVKGAEDYIKRSLDWCGVEIDEGMKKGGDYGPYKQSERTEIYKKHVEVLLANGRAYYAFDKSEKLDWHRKDHEKKGKKFVYNWHNRLKLENSLSLTKEEVEKRIKNKENFVIRFKTPEDKKVKINDLIRGVVEFGSNTLDDKILYKSDGMPTYHLANVVDDYLMNISHVILALLGWNPGTEKEIYTIEELCRDFEIKKINNSGAKFDIDRLKWFNHKHLQSMSNEKIAKLFVEKEREAALMPFKKVVIIIGLIKERANTINQLWGLGKYFFEDPKKYENKVFKKFKSDETIEVLNGVVSIIKENKNHNKKVLGEKIKSWIISGEKSFGKVMQPIRLGLVGELKGVDVFLISEIIGKKRTVYRLELLVKKIKESL